MIPDQYDARDTSVHTCFNLQTKYVGMSIFKYLDNVDMLAYSVKN